MTTPQEPIFSAEKIARAAGISRQTAYALLAGGVSGLTFDELSLDLQMNIARRGIERGFQNGEDYLSKLPEQWKCPLPWSAIPKKHRDSAEKLQRAMAAPLEMRGRSAVAGDIETVGLAEFGAQFGYTISGKQWRRLFHRTIERDAGAENWQRADIYLSDRAFTVPVPARRCERDFCHLELDGAFETLKDRQTPTAEDREFLWDQVFVHYKELLAQIEPGEHSAAKRSLVRYLFQAMPSLCASGKTLLRRFEE